MLIRRLPAHDLKTETAALTGRRISLQMPRDQRVTRRDALCTAVSQTGHALWYPFHPARGLSGGGGRLPGYYSNSTAATSPSGCTYRSPSGGALASA